MNNEKEKKEEEIAEATRPSVALRKRKERQKNRGKGAIADWESCQAETLKRLIGVVTHLKGTITFGYTRDGGAYYLNYFIGGVSDKIWIRPTEDVDMCLLEEIDTWI